MAKTASQLGAGGAFGNVSSCDMVSARKRRIVTIADPDSAAEANCLEFPPHDQPDRGSPLKIGGAAAFNPPTAVASGDRVNAWFTQQGALGTIATSEPSVIYDGGRRDIYATWNTAAHNNSSFVIQNGVAGIRYKVLAVAATCYSFTSAGSIWLTDLVTWSYYVAHVTGLGSWFLTNTPHVLFMTDVGRNLYGYSNGNMSLTWSCTLYQAP